MFMTPCIHVACVHSRDKGLLMAFTLSWASGAGCFSFVCLRFLRCHISLCLSISHRCHVPSGGGRRTAATATDTWIWRFCGEKMKSLCACRARSPSLAHHRRKMERQQEKGKKHVLVDPSGAPGFAEGLFHLTLSKTCVPALRAGRGWMALTPWSLQLSGVLPETRSCSCCLHKLYDAKLFVFL